jgi:small subunit ribosomal protein S6e
MPGLKFVVSDPQTRKSYQLEVESGKAVAIIGKKIGEEFNGDIIGLNGYTLKISGGSDKDGFPMHHQVQGLGRKKVLLSSPPGFHPKLKGERRRKMVCGNTISDSIAQINVKVMKKGEKALEEMFPSKKKAEEKAKPEAEKPKEEVKEKSGGEESKGKEG